MIFIWQIFLSFRLADSVATNVCVDETSCSLTPLCTLKFAHIKQKLEEQKARTFYSDKNLVNCEQNDVY